jgi:TRAP-type uncharacterized transport system fused permease subunit
VAAIEVTGLTLKLSVLFGSLAGNNLFLLLIFTMITAILLGTAVPTPAAYVIVATVLSPLLIRLGLPTLQAHLFPMFFAFLSHLTPPIGIGLLVACKLSGSAYKDGAIEVWKAAFPSLLLPFFFVYSPAILLQYDNVSALIFTVLAICLAFFTLAIFFNRVWKNKLLPLEQVIILLSCLMSMVYIFIDKSFVYVIASLILCIIPLVWNSKRVQLS